MTVRINKDAINLREKLSQLDKPSGLVGEELLRADTPADAREALNLEEHLFEDFESTGIDDNATSTKVTVSDSGVDVTGTVTADGLTVSNLVNGGLAHVRGLDSTLFLDVTSGNNAKIHYDSGDLEFKKDSPDSTNTLVSLKIKQNRNVEFYEDTGTTAKFVWDASAEKLILDADIEQEEGNVKNRITSDSTGFNFTANATSTNVSRNFTFSSSTSGGVVTERMRIDSSGNVGIGTASPSAKLEISSSVGNTKLTGHQILMTRNGNNEIYTQGTSSALALGTNNIERARIDRYGNLLVGKTSTAGTKGVIAYNTGALEAIRDGAGALFVNRLNSDGTIAEFRKDGAPVGSIGTKLGQLYIDSPYGADSGLMIGNSNVSPSNGGNARDNAIDLGYASNRFKDLYLSGGVYLGGTGAANKLDDYETGTYSIKCGDDSAYSSTFSTPAYTKIGNLVTCTARATNVITTGLTGTDVARFTLPFIPDGYSHGSVFVRSAANSDFSGTQRINVNLSSAYFSISNNITGVGMTVADIASGATDLFFTLTYRAV